MRVGVSLGVIWAILLFGALPVRAASVTRGPYLQLGTPDSIVVRWRTDVATPSRVACGTTVDDLNRIVESEQDTTEHELVVGGLVPDTRYYYSVGTLTEVLAGGDADHFFETAPVAGTSKPSRIWVLGDSGSANADAMAVRDAYYLVTGAQHTHLWLMLGDNAYVARARTRITRAAVFDIYPEMLRKSVLWPTFGNHDGIASHSPTETGPVLRDVQRCRLNAEAGGADIGHGSLLLVRFCQHRISSCWTRSAPTATAGGPMLTWLAEDLAADRAASGSSLTGTTRPTARVLHDSDDPWRWIQELTDMREQRACRSSKTTAWISYCPVTVTATNARILIDGHYGFSDTFGPEHVVDGGDGNARRATGVVSSSRPRSASSAGIVARSTRSPATFRPELSGGEPRSPGDVRFSRNELGSVVLDLDGGRLDVTGDRLGTATELDEFSIVKDPDLVVDFSAQPLTGAAPLTVDFTDLSLMRGHAMGLGFR